MVSRLSRAVAGPRKRPREHVGGERVDDSPPICSQGWVHVARVEIKPWV